MTDQNDPETPPQPLSIVQGLANAQAAKCWAQALFLSEILKPSYFSRFLPTEPFVGPLPLPEPDDCPFCGGKALLRWTDFDASVGCRHCFVTTPWRATRREALEIWNERVPYDY